jgi:pentatricopeptide repeat protein
MVPHSKEVMRFEPMYPNFDRIQMKSTGFAVGLPIIGYFRLGSPREANALLDEMLAENSCIKLDNVEIDYYDLNFILFSLPRVKIHADCVQ